jgi:DNA polymerase-1
MPKPEKKLFLLDAMALIYRAHFAFSKNPRINSKGLNTGAVFGFTNTLMEVLNKEKPTHIAVAYDTPEPTFRHIQFEAYKAQRQEQPEDISIAIPLTKKVVQAFNIPVLELPGFEADDIIGTFAKKAAREGFEVFMMTPDKDYGQLVEEHVYLYKPAFMGNAIEILGVNEVCAKFEIQRVDQVCDILGLQGDAVDNIPGIPGVGAKTAVKLLAEFDTVENLVANADQLKGKLRENVEQFGQQGILSKELATINIEVPLTFSEEDLLNSGFDKDKIKAIFEELEFRTTLKRVLGEDTSPNPNSSTAKSKSDPAQLDMFASASSGDETETKSTTLAFKTIADTEHTYHLLESKNRIQKLATFLEGVEEFCFDTETDSLESLSANLVGLSFATQPGEAYYVPLPPADRQASLEILELFRPAFENEKSLKIGQNIKFDLGLLSNYGITLKGPLFDTMLAHYLLEPDQRHNMDALSKSFLNYEPVSIETLIGAKGKNQGNMADVAVETIADYAAEDADITLQLKHTFAPLIEERGLTSLLTDVEGKLVYVLSDMERAGVKVDVSALKEISEALTLEIHDIEKSIYQLAGEVFNIGSPLQLGKILFDKLKLDPKAKKTKTGQYATGEEVLTKLGDEHEIVTKILDYREMAKLKSTYIDALPTLVSPVDGRIHTSYNQAVAATGRLSSTNPNLQNIPIRTARGREIRKAFVPGGPDFTILSADYSQIELRIMASFSKDETMIQAFRDGKDIHAITASRIFKVPLEEVDSDMRRKAKTANFGIIYGISAFGLSQRLNIPRREAGEIIEAYFTEFSAVKQYMDNVINQARETGYVSTVLGRRRYLPDINSRNMTQRGFAERNAINAPIQGSAADMIKLAMINIFDWMKTEKLQSKMILQVHDELVFDAHLSEVDLLKTEVTRLMKTALELEVPMEVGLGTGVNWLDAH